MSNTKERPDILWDSSAPDKPSEDEVDRKTLAEQINESKGM